MKTAKPGSVSVLVPATPMPDATPKRAATKELLIDTGERLFGQHGFDGISLREIATAAGQNNSNVVQYHFKDKSGLVSAILENRVYRLETLRSDMLQKLQESHSISAVELLRILWQPSMTIRDDADNHTFCRFLLQYMIQPHIAQHPLARLYNAPVEPVKKRGKAAEGEQNLPCLIKTTRMLRDLYVRLPEPILNLRMSALSMMFLASVVEHDNALQTGKRGASTEFNIEPILSMSIAALDAAQ